MAHFERVVYGLKNFDLVLVLKDFSQKPLQINSINMEHLEPLKSWLDSCNIKFYEGTPDRSNPSPSPRPRPRPRPRCLPLPFARR